MLSIKHFSLQSCKFLLGPGFNRVIHIQHIYCLRMACRTIGIVAVQFDHRNTPNYICTITLTYCAYAVYVVRISMISSFHESYNDNDNGWYVYEVEGTLIPKAITCVSPLGQCLVWFLSREEAMPVSRWWQSATKHFFVFALAHLPSGVCVSTTSLSGDRCATQIRGPEIFILGVNQLLGVGIFDSKVQRCRAEIGRTESSIIQ